MKPTREVKRYDLGIAKSPLTGQDIMRHLEYADGAWVKYVDIADLLQSPVHLAKPLAESAVASHECGSVPDEPSDDESLIACLGDDAAKLMQSNPGDEMATTMLVAAIRISQLLSRMQPPNNQQNSDHVAVTSAEPESSLTDDRTVRAENYRIDTINNLERALNSARLGYWKQCAVRADTASRSAAKWNHAADIWQVWKAKPSAQQEGKQ